MTYAIPVTFFSSSYDKAGEIFGQFQPDDQIGDTLYFLIENKDKEKVKAEFIKLKKILSEIDPKGIFSPNEFTCIGPITKKDFPVPRLKPQPSS